MIILFDEKVHSLDSLVKENKNVLIDFYAKWCGPCRMLGPVLEEMSEVRPDITIVKIDVDSNPITSRAFNISSVPTLFVFKDGKHVKTDLGFKPQEYLEALF
jgi:thioredoxin 1